MAALPDTARATDLYERYAPRLFGYCLHRLGSREEAEDAVQTTFLNAFRGLSRGVVPQSESAWLFKIAENVCLSRHRASFRRRRVEALGRMETVEETVPAPQPNGDELIPLEAALAEMPKMQRNALLLREWQGLSYREIAARLEVSQSAVETLIFRARRGLARRLEAPRAQLRRVGQAVDLGAVLAALKGALSTGAAVKAGVAAVAVTGVAVGVAVDRPQPRRHDAPPARVQDSVAQSLERVEAARMTPQEALSATPDRKLQSRTAAKPAARSNPKAVAPNRVAAKPKLRPKVRPASPASAVSNPAPPPAAGTAPSTLGKGHQQQAARGRTPGKPESKPAAKPKANPNPTAEDEQPGPPQDPASQGQGSGNGRDKSK